MPTGEFGVADQFRNLQVNVATIGAEMPSATAVAGAATLNALIGKIATEAGTNTAAGNEYTLTLTNSRIAASDFVIASVDRKASTGSPGMGECRVTAGQVVITITNLDAAAAFNASIQINFIVVKALTAGQPGG